MAKPSRQSKSKKLKNPVQKMDGNSYNPQVELLELLKSKCPEAFTEGKIDPKKLKRTLGEEVAADGERYGLSWAGKSDCFRHIQEPTIATLKPAREESIDFDNTENIFIEGDNLQVLKVLQKSYYGKIKMIYIDPPYNTGNNSFIYPDRFAESQEEYLQRIGDKDVEGNLTKDGFWQKNSKDAGHFHSNWLSMMYPRLFLARNLLRPDGVIFVSIDDNEVHNLKMIMNEIFGEGNFVGVFTVNSTPNARDYGHIGKMHEYILFYTKNIAETETFLIPKVEKVFKYTDEKGGFNIHPLYNSNVAFNSNNRPNLFYPFYLYTDKCVEGSFFEIGFEHRQNCIKINPPKSQKERAQFVWRWGKEKSQKYINKEIIGYRTNSGEYRIVQKMRHSAKLIRSLLLDKCYSSRKGTAEVEELFGAKLYSFPKPLELMKKLIYSGSNNSDIILDFFAGSGTTADAVMSLNTEDGGNRKYICVQLAEPCDTESEAYKAGYKTIADIGKERIRRAAKKIAQEHKGKLNFDKLKLDLGFKVFKLTESNFKIWRSDVKTASELKKQMGLFVDNVKSKATQENILYELILKSGLDPNVTIEKNKQNGKQYFTIDNSKLIVCLEDKLTQQLIDKILKSKPEKFLCLDRAFAGNDQLKTNTALQMEAENIDFKVI